jgi:hypoxanthine-DNA glycosylase
MSWAASFSAEVDAQTRVLVLGSMPGTVSLQANQYYAHARNSFWPIMAEVFDFDRNAAYNKRLACLKNAGVGLWDVYSECQRSGSLDAAIDRKTASINDFSLILTHCKNLQAIALNGKAAQQAFKTNVAESLPESIVLLDMPSTSPAYAAMSYEEKKQYWARVKEYV